MHTAGPLADALGIEVNHDYAEGEEAALAAAVLAAPSPVLIVWHHGHIARLAKEIAGEQICLSRPLAGRPVRRGLDSRAPGAHGGAWSFSQVAQCLLPDDCPDVF